MVDFACKEFQIEAVIKCGLNLTKAELQVLKYLLGNDTRWFTTEQVAADLSLDISTVQRSVKKLTEKKVLQKFQNNLDGGGYFFVYRIKNKREIKELIMKIINSWVERVEKELIIWEEDQNIVIVP
ncbi:putative transcriptional regulator [Methanomethylovorans hollandica DSM 15978]|uniref:Putative transcriptional regulator n=1 Tax=Methanomethylovorans hollandica (strain DSM 15978 / NBRC 107637 / DMS1) TaxID=867904 RepID=L0KZ55_METHD|nr:MarR family transcriptional regulator [Methanomethylovorans hollandica]AGB49353.1 putative transcriptional regulator [Methanomethylovorans hollandica DSM 15978]